MFLLCEVTIPNPTVQTVQKLNDRTLDRTVRKVDTSRPQIPHALSDCDSESDSESDSAFSVLRTLDCLT